jgi:hypothetical protein
MFSARQIPDPGGKRANPPNSFTNTLSETSLSPELERHLKPQEHGPLLAVKHIELCQDFAYVIPADSIAVFLTVL